MNKLIHADIYRMLRGKSLRLCILFMLAVAVSFIGIQYKAMDYTVALDRVLFLPMSFFGIAAAAYISTFVSEDFSDGVIINKILSGASRSTIYLSELIVSWIACLTVYFITFAVTLTLGINLFEINVKLNDVAGYFSLGMLTCIVYGSIFCMLSILIGNRNKSIIICMMLSFAMLFLCLHTNQIVVQEAFKNGMPNPDYAYGVKRIIYEYLHDINPTGQAAQLSAMRCLHTVRYISIDIAWTLILAAGGAFAFSKKDIRR